MKAKKKKTVKLRECRECGRSPVITTLEDRLFIICAHCGNFDAEFSELKGKTLTRIEGGVGDDTMKFHTNDGDIFQLKYYRDCCASCTVEEIHGDLSDLIDTPILAAELVVSKDNPPGVRIKYQESFTWSFYKLSTIKGSVTIRWYGESNGYYSETVDFELLSEEKK
jgi:hypothetical protein